MAQWDAFISYARSASTLEAVSLQTAIQTFAKPWHRLRAVRIFRDDSSMSANPALWSTIEEGLRDARWLVVLLSPAAAASDYVANEIRWWLHHKDADHILLVHDEGTLGWDRFRNDFSDASDCVPAPLRGAFREEPRWSDLSWFDATGSSGTADPRFRERVADLAAAIREVPRDQLLGEDVAQHRRSWLLAKLAISGLSLLLIASIVASIVAVLQRNEVLRQANSLLARQLAATSDSLLDRDLRRAQLLAVQAYRTDPTPLTRAALLRAGLASPALRRVLPFAARISVIEPSKDGRFVGVGLETGEVFSWDVAAAAPVSRLKLAQRVSAVGISDDGVTVAAVDGRSVLVATASGPATIALPAGQLPRAVAVAPSGQGIVVGSDDGSQQRLTLVDRTGGTQNTVADPLAVNGPGTADLRFLDNERVLLEGGAIEVRRFPSFTRISRGEFVYGAREMPGRISGDGRFATATNGNPEVPVWPVDGDQNRPTRHAVVPMINEAASALNHNASLIAVADAGGIHLAQVRPIRASGSTDQPQTVTGLSQVNNRGLAFLGTSRRLVAASGSELSLWDPDSAGRTASTSEIDLPFSCTACRPPIVALSSDGVSMAVRDGTAATTAVANVPGEGGGPLGRYSPTSPVGGLAPPVWLADGTVLQLASGSRTLGGTLEGPLPGLPEGFAGWAIGRPDAEIVAVRQSSDDSTLVVVTSDGWIGRYETRTGRQLGRAQPGGLGSVGRATISPDLTSVALRLQETAELVVLDAATGTERFRLGNKIDGVDEAAFGAESLWVRYFGGTLSEHDPAIGELRKRFPERFFGYGAPVVTNTMLAVPTDVGVTLYDLTDGSRLGGVDFPTDRRADRHGIDLSSDGSRLVTVFEAADDAASGLVVSTVLDPERLVAMACRTSGASLTVDDWQALVGGTPPADLTCR